MKRFLAILFIAGLFFSCATSQGALFESIVDAGSQTEDSDEPGGKQAPDQDTALEEPASEDAVTEDTEVEEPEYGIHITTDPSSAMIFVNGSLVGAGSVLVTPAPGTYQVTARREGYYPETVWVTYEEETQVILSLDLKEITGYLFLEVEPRGAEITINGYGASEGVTELQIGSYSVRVRLFGYEEWRGSVSIREMQTTKVQIELSEAAFMLSDISASRRVFSPKNPGILGTTRISFEVSSWGEGRLVVRDLGGQEVFTRQLKSFSTWGQSTDWDGRDETGSPLADGEYRLSIEARGRDTAAAESIMVQVTIDNDAVISYRGGLSGLSGTLFAPTPEVLPAGSFQFGVGTMGHYSSDDFVFPTYVTVRAGLGEDSEIDLSGALFINSFGETPYSGGLGLKYRVAALAGGQASFGVTGKLTYVGNTTIDTFANFTGLSAGLTAQLNAGPFSLIVSPDIVVSPFSVSYDGAAESAGINSWLYGRAGILADFGSITTAISGAVRTVRLSHGFALDLPFSAGAEIHWLLPGTQIVLSGSVVGEFNSADNFYILGGGSIGIIN